MKPSVLKLVIGVFKLILCVVTIVFSGFLVMERNPTPHTIGIAIGLIGILITFNTFVIDAIFFSDTLKNEFKVAQYQNLILDEIKKNNNTVISLVIDQANLLTKMTSIVVKKDKSCN